MNEKLNSLVENLKNPDEVERKYAVQDIADLEDPQGVSYLLPCLEDPSITVREAAVDALIQLGGSSTCEAVFPCLSSENVSLRNYACEVLQNIGINSVPVLVEQGLKSENLDVLKFSLDILGKIKGLSLKETPDAIHGIGKHLSDQHENISIAAAEALGMIADPDAIPLLISAISGPLWIQCAIVQAIAQVGGQNALNSLKSLDPQKLDPQATQFLQAIIQGIEVP